MSSRLFTALAFAIGVVPVTAQSFNLDFGESTAHPSSSYAAAGLAGFWNAIRADPSTYYVLQDVTGATTNVQFHQYGGTALIASGDPSVTGDDALLMDDGLITYNPGLDSCFYFDGLVPGVYELITYAWRPDYPSQMAKSFVDNTPGLEISGGAWPGSHVHGVTYARHIVTVDGSGFMGPHSGLAAGADQAIGAVCNGMQLRRIDVHVAFCFGDGTGTACPCGNPGLAGRGCDNFGSATGGASFSATGLPLLSSDSLVLSAAAENSAALTIFWTGSNVSSSQGVVHGAGIRCVSGLSRLYTGSASGGAITRPGSSDPSVSARSAAVGAPIQAGETRYYFTIYRDPQAATPCGNSASTVNLSNAVAVQWIE